MKSKFFLIIVCILLFGSITFAAGGKDEGTMNSAPSDFALNVWIAGDGDTITRNIWNQIFAAYTAQTDIAVEVTYVPWSEYFTKLNTSLIGGGGPDIFVSGYGQFGTLLNNEYLLSMDEYISPSWDGYTDIPQNILDMSIYNGQNYGVFIPATRIFLYRKDIAEQNGVTEDELHITTMDDFLNLARKMTVYDDNGNVELFGLELSLSSGDTEQSYIVFTSMLSDSVKLWDENYNPIFETEVGITAWQTLVDLYEKEDIAYIRDASAGGSSGIASGIAAIAMQAETAYATANAAFPGKIGILKSEMNTLLIGDYFCINKETTHKQEAVDLLLHMVSKNSFEIRMTEGSLYPVRKSLQDAYSNFNPEFENIVLAYQNSYPFATVPFSKYNQAISGFRTNMQSPFYGVPVEEAFAKATENWKDVVNE